nr:LamG domain-containing protein [Pirellulaceae bacterium]
MSISSRSVTLAAILVLLISAACSAGDAVGPLYLRQENLQKTLLTTRQRYTAWLADQPAARAAVEFSPWLATPPLPSTDAEKHVRPAESLDPTAKHTDGRALWTTQNDLPDGKVVKFLSGSGGTVACLARTVRAKQPVRLTVGIGGGEQLRVWLNGQPIASADTHLVSGRYGCSECVDGTRVDQVLVDLDLQAGENTLLGRLTLGEEPSFYFSASPDPVPRLWEQIRRDFPADQNPLLDLVHADWFAPRGWFAAESSQAEEQLVEQLVPDCGSYGDSLRAERDQIKQTQADRDDPRWLDLCVKTSVLATLGRDLARLRAAVSELGRAPAAQYPAAELLGRLDEYERELTALAAGRVDPADAPTRRLMEQMPAMRRRMLVDLNPLLRDTEILFVKRSTYNSKHYYDDFQHISRWGGNLCVLSLASGQVREMVPSLDGGIFDRYDLSFDAQRIVFGYRRPQLEGFRLWEVGVDGTGLRQVTHPPADEERRIAMYGKTSTGDSFYGLLGYQFWTDDVHPCYLPDGGLCFASTRSEHGVLCTPNHYLACTNLFRMDADGSGMRPISQGALSEFTPTLMEDGRILYNRWEYVYKGIAAVQPLWITRPDGSGSEEFYGDNIANPGVFWQARQVPGHPRLAVCIGCGHEPLGVGQVLLLDLNKEKRTPEPMLSLTPNVKTQNLRGLYQLRNGVWREDIYGPFYSDPYPLSDKFFLVSCNPDRRYNDPAGYGIHLLDAFGNRVPIYADPEISCWQPMPLRPRPTPPVLPAVTAPRPESKDTATVFLSDVYRGLDGLPPGTIKYLRVLEQIPKPWAAEVDACRDEDRGADGFGGHLAVSWNSHIWIAVLHGIVPVEADGSACFEVPAGRNLFFQALDQNFMAVQRMRTFVNFEPGEQRSCIGCHEHRRQAPVSRMAAAFGRTPASLAAQPGESAPRPLYYPTDVQPMLDQHCVRCHNGQDPKAPPDLRGELTTLFNRSYEALLQGKFVATVQEWNGGSYAMQNAEAVPPYTHGAHASRLVKILQAGHYDVQLPMEDWIKLVTWIDTGAPYYGSYYGRRHLRYQGQPDFRPVPTIESACGIPPPLPELAPPDPLPARLLAWWPLDDSTPGVAADASGQERHAKAIGVSRSEGPDGRGAGRFDGKSYLECDGLGAHEAISIALRIKAGTLGNQWNPLLFCHEGQPGAVHFSLLSDGVPNVAINTGDWNWTHRKARATLADGQWHHVILVCDGRLGGSVRFYVDGRLSSQQRLNLGQQLDLYRFRIGAWNRWESSPANNFHGEIGDVRVYSGMLTDAEA